MGDIDREPRNVDDRPRGNTRLMYLFSAPAYRVELHNSQNSNVAFLSAFNIENWWPARPGSVDRDRPGHVDILRLVREVNLRVLQISSFPGSLKIASPLRPTHLLEYTTAGQG